MEMRMMENGNRLLTWRYHVPVFRSTWIPRTTTGKSKNKRHLENINSTIRKKCNGPGLGSECRGRTQGRRFEQVIMMAGSTRTGAGGNVYSSGGNVASVDGNMHGGRRLMVAVDTSSGAREMCEWVVENVYRKGDVVDVVHCVPPLPKVQGLYTLEDGRLAMVDVQKLLRGHDSYEVAVERVLNEFVYSTFKHMEHVQVETHVLHERAFEAGNKHSISQMLCHTAEEIGADLMIVASHSTGGLMEAYSGSIAADCARHCDVPVMVFHDAQARRLLSGEASESGRFGNVLVKWMNEIGKKEFGGKSPGVEGTVVEKIAVSAASGPFHARYSHKNGEDLLVSSKDFDDEEYNLIGQMVSEVPGFDTSVDEHDNHRVVVGNTIRRRLLIPVDDSDASERAMDWVIEHLFRKHDEVILLHMIPSLPSVLQVNLSPSFGVSPAYFYVSESITDDYRKASEKILEERFFSKLRQKGITHRAEIIVELTDSSSRGIGEAICERSKELDANVIVLGSHSRGGISEMMLGSVANWVDHHSPVPVIVIH